MRFDVLQRRAMSVCRPYMKPKPYFCLIIGFMMIDSGFITCKLSLPNDVSCKFMIFFSILWCKFNLTVSARQWANGVPSVQTWRSPLNIFKTLDKWMLVNLLSLARYNVNLPQLTLSRYQRSFSIVYRPSLKRRIHMQIVAYFKASFQ